MGQFVPPDRFSSGLIRALYNVWYKIRLDIIHINGISYVNSDARRNSLMANWIL